MMRPRLLKGNFNLPAINPFDFYNLPGIGRLFKYSQPAPQEWPVLPSSELGPYLDIGENVSINCGAFSKDGERFVILASSGKGKSYLSGAMQEEELEIDRLACIVDPEGECYTLQERYDMLIVGGPHADCALEMDKIEQNISTMLNLGISTIFDLKGIYSTADQRAFYTEIASQLFRQQEAIYRPMSFFVDEAQQFASQEKKKSPPGSMGLNAEEISVAIAKQGRKRGIRTRWITQRPQALLKDVISQCNGYFLGGMPNELDRKAIRPFLLENKIPETELMSLQAGNFIYWAFGDAQRLKVRTRLCTHAGATPDDNREFYRATSEEVELIRARAKQ